MTGSRGPTPIISTVSELLAYQNNRECKGDRECHWCGAKCPDYWTHDDPPPVPFQRTNGSKAKRPGSAWMCIGCWLYRRPKVTVRYFDQFEMPTKALSVKELYHYQKTRPNFLDGQCLVHHSWIMTARDTWVLRPSSSEEVYKFLLKPPLLFSLSLLKGQKDNHLQLAIVNQHERIEAGTRLHYTINGIPHFFTVYELEEALLLEDATGKDPGVRALLEFFDKPSKLFLEQLKGGDPKQKPKAGRPPLPKIDGKVIKEVISGSGLATSLR